MSAKLIHPRPHGAACACEPSRLRSREFRYRRRHRPAGIPITGRLFTDIYFPAKNLDTNPYLQSSASLWLQGDTKLGEHGSAHFVLAGNRIETNIVSSIGPQGPQFDINLREAYAAYTNNGWEWRLGQQIIPWGKSDAINPTDFLTAKDYTFFNPDQEVIRVGAVSLYLTWTPNQGNSPWSFTVVGTPAFAESTILIPPTSVPQGVTVVQPVIPAQTIGNSETAFKVSYASSSWDASLLAFRGFNHLPQFALLAIGSNGSVPSYTVGQTFYPIRAAGGDFSFTHGKWIFRGETAYIWTNNNTGTNTLIEPTHWDSVVGVERPLGDDFRVQVQFIDRFIPNFTPPGQLTGPDPVTTQVENAISNTNALLLAYQEQNRPGATFRISYTNEAKGIDAEIFLLGNFVGGDYLLQPKFSYNWTDALKTTFGVDWYGGPTDRPLGALAVYSAFFAEAKYTF